MVREGDARETALNWAIKEKLSHVMRRGNIQHLQRHGDSQQHGVHGEMAARALGRDLGQSGKRKAQVRETSWEAAVTIQSGEDDTL